MQVPLFLLILSLSGLVAALTLPGMHDAALLAGPCVLACLILLGRAWLLGQGRIAVDLPAPPRRGFRLRRGADRIILIDGSNVLHWKDNRPQIETLREVVVRATALGFSPAVVFDANAGYLIAGKYQHDKALAELLGLPEDRVMVTHKGQPADPVLLAAARDIGARIITNDRFRDWACAYPEVLEQRFLVRGSYRDDRLWLDLDETVSA